MSGQTPSAKRPVNKATIDMAAGGNRPMSMEDLVAGFHNLANLGQREDKFTDDMSKCVAWNAALLNAVVSRINTMEQVVGQQTDEIGKQNDKLDTLTEGVKRALGQAKDDTTSNEHTLRGELSAMAEKLDNGHKELTTKVGQLEAVLMAMPVPGTAPAPPPGISPNTELLSLNMNKLNTIVEEINSKVGGLEKHAQQMQGRAGDLEMNAKFSTASIQEIQGAITAMRVEIHQLVLDAGVKSTGGNGGATAGADNNSTAGGLFGGPPIAQPDPWFGQNLGQARGPTAPCGRPQTQHFSTATPDGQMGREGESAGRNNRWKLYDESFIMPPSLTSNTLLAESTSLPENTSNRGERNTCP